MKTLLIRLAFFLLGLLVDNAAKLGDSILVKAAVLLAWATFLGVFWHGVTTLGLREILTSDAFTAAPAGVLALIDACFPLNFAISAAFAYISFKFTVMLAAETMSRAIKALFGG